MITALAFTALVTPYEVALLETQLNPLFVVNRVVDGIFLIDMALQLFVVIALDTPEGTFYVKERKKIALRYLRGWFGLDLISILPFDLVGMLVGSGDVARLKSIRLIRLFRLILISSVRHGAANCSSKTAGPVALRLSKFAFEHLVFEVTGPF